jgi:hypothetical protein
VILTCGSKMRTIHVSNGSKVFVFKMCYDFQGEGNQFVLRSRCIITQDHDNSGIQVEHCSYYPIANDWCNIVRVDKVNKIKIIKKKYDLSIDSVCSWKHVLADKIRQITNTQYVRSLTDYNLITVARYALLDSKKPSLDTIHAELVWRGLEKMVFTTPQKQLTKRYW